MISSAKTRSIASPSPSRRRWTEPSAGMTDRLEKEEGCVREFRRLAPLLLGVCNGPAPEGNPAHSAPLAARLRARAQLANRSRRCHTLLSVLAIVPLATLLSHATESVAAKTGDAAGGLLNATVRNLSELVIGLAALRAGECVPRRPSPAPSSPTRSSCWARGSCSAASSIACRSSTKPAAGCSRDCLLPPHAQGALRQRQPRRRVVSRQVV
jgi:hypothetical protein